MRATLPQIRTEGLDPAPSRALVAALAIACAFAPAPIRAQEDGASHPEATAREHWSFDVYLSHLPRPLGAVSCIEFPNPGIGVGTALHTGIGDLFSVSGGVSAQLPVPLGECYYSPRPLGGEVVSYPDAYGKYLLVSADVRLAVHLPGTKLALPIGGGWLWMHETPYLSAGARLRIHSTVLVTGEFRGYTVPFTRYDREYVDGRLVSEEILDEGRKWILSPTIRVTIPMPLPFR